MSIKSVRLFATLQVILSIQKFRFEVYRQINKIGSEMIEFIDEIELIPIFKPKESVVKLKKKQLN